MNLQLTAATKKRVNLRLWPEATHNIAHLAACNGDAYNETLLAARIGGDDRAVRQTLEAMAYVGLACREGTPPRFRLSSLGEGAMSFLGNTGGPRLLNESNVDILSSYMAQGLAVIGEYRAIWCLMRATENRLSNEELNRAVPLLSTLDDVEPVAEKILRARLSNDPTLIGARVYDVGKYGTPEASDQRKAINVLFLLAGAGGLLIEVSAGNEERSFTPWAVSLVDAALRKQNTLRNMSNDADTVRAMAKASNSPADVRGQN